MTGPVLTGPAEHPVPGGNVLPSVVRTAVPIVAGIVLVALAKLGLSLDDGVATTLAESLVAVVYYTGVRFLETRGNAQWGWLLGLAKAPAYSPEPPPSPEAGEEMVATPVLDDEVGELELIDPDGEPESELDPDVVMIKNRAAGRRRVRDAPRDGD